MSTQRTIVSSLVVCLACIAAVPAFGSDFRTRLAAWQGGEPVAPPAGTTPPSAGTSAAQAEKSPADLPKQQQSKPTASPRLLAESYSAPVHASEYHNPWGGCNFPHGPTCVAPSDPYGTCQMDGGGPLLPGNHGCGICCGGEHCGEGGPWCCNTLVWAKFDVLMWWRQGRDFPPLVTTDPVTESSITAGVLPNAEILFGGDRVGTDMQAGGRFDIGTWIDPRQCWGIGWRFFGLGKDASEFNITSLDNPVLALPFLDVEGGVNNAFLIAFPGLRSGEIHTSAVSEVLGNDVYARFLLCRGPGSRLDFLTGWHYSRILDGIQIRSRSTITEVGGTITNGTVFDTRDQFDARNEFNGGILGLMWEQQCGCWTTNVLARMSLGNMHETMQISGSTTIAVPGQAAATTPGGSFTADSNIGTFSRDEFTAVTELGVTFAYRFAPCTQLTFGYTFMYWNDVLSPGTAIDTNISPTGAEDRPRFDFRHSDYWVQGINLGITKEF